MSSNSLQVAGLISGLSTHDIVDKMMELERAPITSLQRRKDEEQQRQDALRDVSTRLVSLLSTIQKLNLRSTIDVKTVSTDTPPSTSAFVSATANADAALASFTMRVRALATATTVVSGGAATPEAIGGAVAAGEALGEAGFGITPTTGTFTVNGVQIAIDDSTVLSDGTDAEGANTVFAKIRDATASLDAAKRVTVSWGLDANGRQNKLVLSAASTIQLGAGSDSSNFLTAAGLAALPPATTMTSARNLGGVNASSYLSSADANLDVALSSSTGEFKINGVSISYDASVDTLNTVLNRINASAANVTASYDSANDRVTLTSKATGSKLISLEDVTGNFLATLKVSSNDETLGTNASYLLNGEQRYSISNTVTDAVQGVTLSLKKADDATDVTLTVNQDTFSAISAVQDFVDQYNSTVGLIREKTSYNAQTKLGGLLMGDSTVQRIETTLSSFVNGYGDGLSSVARSLSDIGVTTGAVGSVVGSAKSLVLDTATLTAKLQSNSAAVAEVFGALTSNVSLQAAGTGSISSVSGKPSNHISGTYVVESDASGNLTATFTPDGGASSTVATGKITASGANTTLIPGVTLTGKGALVAGSDTISASFTSKGVGVKIADYLSSLTSVTGAFSKRQESAEKEIEDMNKSIERMQDRLDEKEQSLYARFAALETALSRLQGQSSAIASQLARLSSSSGS